MLNKTEKEITKNWPSNWEQPVVTVKSLVFNHKAYIETCLDSLLSQETDFPFQIYVHDDASTDGTTDIIRKYQEKYPHIIIAIIEEKNTYSNRVLFSETVNSPQYLKGKYIACCEGDDFWIDPLKLRKQVNFLESNPAYTMCFSNALIYNDLTETDIIVPNEKEKKEISVEDLVRKGASYVPTPSILYRNELLSDYPLDCKQCVVGDYPLQIFCGIKGKVACIPETLAAYRTNAKNSWTSKQRQIPYAKRLTTLKSIYSMLNSLNKYTAFKYNSVFFDKKIELFPLRPYFIRLLPSLFADTKAAIFKFPLAITKKFLSKCSKK